MRSLPYGGGFSFYARRFAYAVATLWWRLFYIDGSVYAMEVFVSFKVRDCFLLAHKISRRHIYEQNSE